MSQNNRLLFPNADVWPQSSDWLIRDEFTDTVAAGSVNGTAATPGPGTRAVTDTESKISVGSNALAFAGGKASPASTDPGFYYETTSGIGVALIAKNKVAVSTTENSNIYLHSSAAITNMGDAGYYFISDDSYPRVGATTFTSIIVGATPGAYATFAIVQKTAGALFCSNVGAGWRLDWVSVSPTWGANSYAGGMNFSGARDLDFLRVIALPAPFDTNDGLATDTHSGSVAAGTTFTHEGDVWMEFIATTVPSGDSIDVQFRKADSLNYWICRINSSGNISLEEVVDGSETQRGLAAGVVSNGHRVVIIADGTTIKGYSNNTLRWTYSSASNFATTTAGAVALLGTGGAVSNLKTWPRTLSGTAASILNKVSA